MTRPVGARPRHLRRGSSARNEREAAERGVAIVLDVRRATSPRALFLGAARLDGDRAAPRLGATIARSGPGAGRRVDPFDNPRDAAEGWPNHVVRDAQHLNWRYVESPRGYRTVRSGEGYAVVGRSATGDRDGGSRRPRRPARALVRCAISAAAGRLLIALPAREQRAASSRSASCPLRTRSIAGQGADRRAERRPVRLALHARRHGLLLSGGSSSSRSRSTPGTRRWRRRCRRSARSRSGWTRWSCSPTARSPGTLPGNCRVALLRRPREGGARRTLRDAARARARAAAGRRRRAHVPDLRGACGAARAAAAGAAPALVHALEAGRGRWRRPSARRPP